MDSEILAMMRRSPSSPYMLQRIIDRLAFRLAFVLLEVGLQLLLCLARVQQKLLPRAKSQAADVAVRQARRLADKSCDLQVALRHASHDGKAVASGQMCCAAIGLSGVSSRPSISMMTRKPQSGMLSNTSSIF